MSKYARLRIHIAPLGFETDRIVLPAVEMKADTVWILIHNDDKQKDAKSYLDDIKIELKKERIELKIMKLNRLDLSSTIKGVRIIMDEGGDNTYYVNVSSGSKIQAVACTMACMMFNEKNNLIPYYVQPKKYFAYNGEQMSTGLEKIIDLPQYNIKTPDKKLIQTLQIIKKNDNRITKSNLAKAVDDKKIIEIGSKDNYEQARFTSLDKNIIKPLKDNWKFVKEDKIGRTRWVEITPEGKNILDILDDDEMSL
jgi:hypothetical protein